MSKKTSVLGLSCGGQTHPVGQDALWWGWSVVQAEEDKGLNFSLCWREEAFARGMDKEET